MKKIGVIGAGSWGTALAVTLSDKGHSVRIWDLDKEFTVDPADFLSMGRATPFEGWKLNGVCLMTVKDGKVVYQNH